MIKGIIIDDDANLRSGLKNLLQKVAPEIEIVAQADGVKNGVKTIEETDSDVLFLDIQMGDGTGFDILEQLLATGKTIHQQVVFITAFEQYAIKAFRFSALDYLLKPVDADELRKVVDKIIKAVAQSQNINIDLLLENIRKKSDEIKRIVLSNSDGSDVYEIKDIIRCESSDNYTRFFFQNRKPILISKTLKEYEELLAPHQFERVHQSHLVNMAFVKHFQTKNGCQITLLDDSIVPVSQRKKDKFQALLKQL